MKHCILQQVYPTQLEKPCSFQGHSHVFDVIGIRKQRKCLPRTANHPLLPPNRRRRPAPSRRTRLPHQRRIRSPECTRRRTCRVVDQSASETGHAYACGASAVAERSTQPGVEAGGWRSEYRGRGWRHGGRRGEREVWLVGWGGRG